MRNQWCIGSYAKPTNRSNLQMHPYSDREVLINKTMRKKNKSKMVWPTPIHPAEIMPPYNPAQEFPSAEVMKLLAKLHVGSKWGGDKC